MELQWKEQNESDQQQSCAFLNHDCYYQSTELPLFTSESSSTKLNLSSTAPSSRMGGSSYFSPAQWQELELQALIFRHMIAGAPVPPQLLHLVKKSLILNSPYYHSSPYHPALLHSGSGGGGYWGRGGMDPEPGRCRRTDGKKWRCSRDVVGGHKYCERHMHRGRNRSRKPVEIPTPNTATPTPTPTPAVSKNCNNNARVLIHTNTSPSVGAAHPPTPSAFGFSGSSHSFDLLHPNQRSSETINDAKGLYRTPKSELPEDGTSGGGQVLRHFFDDLPVQGSEYNMNNAGPGTSLSISVPGNQSSDISLKLSTGDDDNPGYDENVGREQHQLQWGSSATSWGTNQMGGPLAEALRSSSTSTSSPTSVLQQLRGAANFIST